MNNWSICWLTARRLYKSFVIKGLINDVTFNVPVVISSSCTIYHLVTQHIYSCCAYLVAQHMYSSCANLVTQHIYSSCANLVTQHIYSSCANFCRTVVVTFLFPS
jgi:hypothetical protein